MRMFSKELGGGRKMLNEYVWCHSMGSGLMLNERGGAPLFGL